MAQRTLIALAIVFTGLAFLAAEADFWSPHRRDGEHYHYRSTGLTSFRVAHRGSIELDEAESAILRMSPDARLEVAERRFTSRWRLVVTPDPSGRPVYELERGARELSTEEAKEYLASVLDEVLRVTTVGAEPRARRLLAGEGLDGLLREVTRLDSNAARRIYLDVAAGMEGLEPEGAARIIETAGREMTSSSRLRALLAQLAEELPVEWPLTAELAMAAERIPSSSEKGVAIVAIAEARAVTAADAPALGDAVASIPSSSEKGRTIRRLYRLGSSPELAHALIAAADTIESSSERERVLSELVAPPDLPEEVYIAALDAASEIASSTAKASFLAGLAPRLPAGAEHLHLAYVEVARGIASSSEAKRALVALLTATDLSAPACRAWIDTVGDLASPSQTSEALVEAAGRCPGSPAMARAFLEAVEDLGASSMMRSSLLAFLDRPDLEPALLEGFEAVAERSIPGSSDREAVLDRLRAVRASLSAGSERPEPPEPDAEAPEPR